MRTGYKVLAGLRSPHAPRGVEYRVGKWTCNQVGDGPLAVFSSLPYAQFFARDADAVWRCEYLPYQCYPPDLRYMLWTSRHMNRELVYRQQVPMYTAFARAVKLLEVVE